MQKVNVTINPTHPDSLEINGGIYEMWKANRAKDFDIYRKKWESNPLNFIVEKYPLNLDMEPTNLCNLKCPMCPRTLALKQDKNSLGPGEVMPFSMYKKVLDEVSDENGCNVYAIKLTHRGEPLINPELPKMIAYAKEKGAIDVMTNTNATILNAKLSEEILDAGIDRMLFSFDAASKEKFEAIRIGAVYEEVLENIKEFVALRNKKKAWNTLVRVTMVMNDETLDEIEAYKKLFTGVADVISFNRVVKEPQFVSECEVEIDGKVKNINHCMFACSQHWQRLVINSDGNVEVCCPNFKEDYVIGNVKDSSIEELWHCDKLNTIRELHKKGEWHKIPMCKKCNVPWMV